MEIRLSKYNAPFSEPSTSEIHYISLDDQRDIRAGHYFAHVAAYLSATQLPFVPFRSHRTFHTDDTFEVFDPISGVTFTYERGNNAEAWRRSKISTPVVVDRDFVEVLRNKKVSVSTAALSRCTCGNARRPWKCTCHK